MAVPDDVRSFTIRDVMERIWPGIAAACSMMFKGQFPPPELDRDELVVAVRTGSLAGHQVGDTPDDWLLAPHKLLPWLNRKTALWTSQRVDELNASRREEL